MRDPDLASCWTQNRPDLRMGSINTYIALLGVSL